MMAMEATPMPCCKENAVNGFVNIQNYVITSSSGMVAMATTHAILQEQ